MQPFVNPYLFQNPYYSNIGNGISQNTQNTYNPINPNCNPMNPIGINGKYVNDFAEITASDVPMGGQPSIFVRNDRSEIQLREWSPNGQIVSTQYVPFAPAPEEPTNNQVPLFNTDEILTPIFEKISMLEEKIDKLSKPTQVKARKEGE